MLKKVGLGWEFESESILEDFIWNNLESFFDLIPIARQYRTSNNQICDLLAKTKKGFHRDNFTDIKYHKLYFDLWQFNVIDREDRFYLQVLGFRSLYC